MNSRTDLVTFCKFISIYMHGKPKAEARIQAKIRVKKQKIAKIGLEIILSWVESYGVFFISLSLPIKTRL